MPLRTLSIQKLSDVTKIWEEAERRLGASRANFSLVRSGSRYLPPDGFLDSPEQLFEIRWQGRGGAPRFQFVAVIEGEARPAMGDKSLTLSRFLEQIEWEEYSDQVVAFYGGPKIEGKIWDDEDLPLIDYFNQCEQGRDWVTVEFNLTMHLL
jgi:hypothetical protein